MIKDHTFVPFRQLKTDLLYSVNSLALQESDFSDVIDLTYLYIKLGYLNTKGLTAEIAENVRSQ